MKIDAPPISYFPALRSLWREAFNDTEEFLNAFFDTAFHADRCRCVTIDDKVTAALYWFDCVHMGRHIAYLYAVATANEFRGQGICHKLMENTHRHLAGLGYEGVILVPGNEQLFPFYSSMGYQTCCQLRKFRCSGATEQIPLWQIEKNEYARLRRQLLPEGGVIQENENLDFLQTQATFYAGQAFLLAACESKDVLYGVELLGDETAAPKIVYTLGYAQGSFRTPGKGTPFAMYLPLGECKPSPSYFGLAFD